MRRVTITLPDDLEASLERYLEEPGTPSDLTTVILDALREYLQNIRLQERGYRPPQGAFNIDPIDGNVGSETDVSLKHDAYFGKP